MYHLDISETGIDNIDSISNGMRGVSIYTQEAYLKALSAIRPVKCYVIRSNNNIAGVFPLIDRKKLFIRYAPQPSFTQYFGIMTAVNAHSEQKQMDFFDRIVNQYSSFLNKRYRAFLLPQHYDYTDMRPFIWKNLKCSVLYTYHFAVNMENMQRIDRRIRNKESEAFEISQDIEMLYKDVHASYNGKPPLSKSDFSIMMKHLISSGIVKIYRNSEAAVCFLIDDTRKILYEYAAAGKNTGRLIRDVFAGGAFEDYLFDFQGANTESIARYKALFNPVLKQYFCIRKRI